ncbi:hypothetical protein GE253_10935 [Niveispirillum sp. SYP-B3756]|uniref:hypothetical protein n=1 Tax=Niveispirillum sp. SYP-B3756 TaxID=2662178 RepID=UPI00129230B8|nr:hypothetical protein [Niveispirillum sp. SYP-B3756]MQP65855.1 hypothetical protein [Niveispirillum sp. SYP-B3756]
MSVSTVSTTTPPTDRTSLRDKDSSGFALPGDGEEISAGIKPAPIPVSRYGDLGMKPVNLALVPGMEWMADYNHMEVTEYHESLATYHRRLFDFASEILGRDGKPARVGGLSGSALDMVRQAAATQGILPPEKPRSLLLEEAASGKSASPLSENAARGDTDVGIITIMLPAEEGGGEQHILVDPAQWKGLAAQHPPTAVASLLNMLDNSAKAVKLNDTMLHGLFGKFMQANSDEGQTWHDKPVSRYGYSLPGTSDRTGPAFMVEAYHGAALSPEKAMGLAAGLLRLAQAAAPGGNR